MLHRGPAPTVFDRQPPPPGVVETALLDLLSGTPTERTQLAMVREPRCRSRRNRWLGWGSG